MRYIGDIGNREETVGVFFLYSRRLTRKLHEGFGNQGVMGKAVGLIGRRMSLERIRTMRSIGPEGVAGRTPGIKSIAVAMV